MKIKQAMNTLKENGYRLTKKRKDLLDYFQQSTGYRTAKDLIEHMEKMYPGISFDTVYRNLHLYTDLNILESTELNGEKHFRMKCSDEHHHHFICNDCGKTKAIDLCPMNELGNVLKDYEIEDHKFEIYGLCPRCQTA
ncbi:MAG TPA: Fur family transcriptional regulator [Bacillota bacterium]|nr:Fur family transcriptional regulator [Bacillota bacterium]